VRMFLSEAQQSLQRARAFDAPPRKHGLGPGVGLRSDPIRFAEQVSRAAFQAADLVRMDVLAVGVETSPLAPHMHGDLFLTMIEHSHQPRIPPRPDLASQVLRRHGVISFGDFDVTVASDDALRFLKAGKAFDGKRRQSRAFDLLEDLADYQAAAVDRRAVRDALLDHELLKI